MHTVLLHLASCESALIAIMTCYDNLCRGNKTTIMNNDNKRPPACFYLVLSDEKQVISLQWPYHAFSMYRSRERSQQMNNRIFVWKRTNLHIKKRIIEHSVHWFLALKLITTCGEQITTCRHKNTCNLLGTWQRNAL